MDTQSTGNDALDAINAKLGTGTIVEPSAIGGINGGKNAPDNADGSDGNNNGDRSGAGEGGVRYNRDGSIAKKRGRKPGSGSAAGSSPARKAKTPDGISTVLFSLHLMASNWLKVDELALDKEEADLLATSIDEVQRFYNVQTSAEVLLWMGVIGTCITVYGPRAGAIIARKQKEKAAKPRPVPTAQPVPGKQAEATPVNPGVQGFDYPPTE